MIDPDARVRRTRGYESDRLEVQALVPRSARRILDLGCSSGAIGVALKRRQQAEVVGVEIDPTYAADAERRLDRVLNADLEELMERSDLEGDLGRFDCLLAADVLEHLRDPWTVLRRTASLLAPGGTAVISLPNVRYWQTFWWLGWHGTWPRRDEGLFDRTHLRWFALTDALELVEQAGLDVADVKRQYRAGFWSERWDRRVAKLHHTPLRPFFVAQNLIVARASSGPVDGSAHTTPGRG